MVVVLVELACNGREGAHDVLGDGRFFSDDQCFAHDGAKGKILTIDAIDSCIPTDASTQMRSSRWQKQPASRAFLYANTNSARLVARRLQRSACGAVALSCPIGILSCKLWNFPICASAGTITGSGLARCAGRGTARAGFQQQRLAGACPYRADSARAAGGRAANGRAWPHGAAVAQPAAWAAR